MPKQQTLLRKYVDAIEKAGDPQFETVVDAAINPESTPTDPEIQKLVALTRAQTKKTLAKDPGFTPTKYEILLTQLPAAYRRRKFEPGLNNAIERLKAENAIEVQDPSSLVPEEDRIKLVRLTLLKTALRINSIEGTNLAEHADKITKILLVPEERIDNPKEENGVMVLINIHFELNGRKAVEAESPFISDEEMQKEEVFVDIDGHGRYWGADQVAYVNEKLGDQNTTTQDRMASWLRQGHAFDALNEVA